MSKWNSVRNVTENMSSTQIIEKRSKQQWIADMKKFKLDFTVSKDDDSTDDDHPLKEDQKHIVEISNHVNPQILKNLEKKYGPTSKQFVA